MRNLSLILILENKYNLKNPTFYLILVGLDYSSSQTQELYPFLKSNSFSEQFIQTPYDKLQKKTKFDIYNEKVDNFYRKEEQKVSGDSNDTLSMITTRFREIAICLLIFTPSCILLGSEGGFWVVWFWPSSLFMSIL